MRAQENERREKSGLPSFDPQPSLCDAGVLALQIYNIDGAVVGVIVILGHTASQKLVDCEMEHFCP